MALLFDSQTLPAIEHTFQGIITQQYHVGGVAAHGIMTAMNTNYQSIITLEAGKRSGKATIRGMRITVYDVLSYLAAGMTVEEILTDFPYLTIEDVQASLSYAADRERQMLVISA